MLLSHMRAIRAAISVVFILTTLIASAAQTFLVAPPRLGPAPYQRNNVKVAASSDQFLVAWHDGREQWNLGRGRTFVSRISRDGVLRDPAGIAVGQDLNFYGASSLYSVASNGTDFLVATRRDGNKVQLTKITRDGLVEPAPAIDIPAHYANLVSLGDGYALFYNENLSVNNVVLSTRGKVVVLDREGRVVRASVDIVASTGEVWDLNAALSGDGDSMLLIWKDTGDGRVHARPMSAAALRNGDVTFNSDLDTPAVTAAFDLDIVSGGDRYFVTWIQGQEYRARILNTSGGAVGGIITVATTQFPSDIDVAWNGARFIAAYTAFEGLDRTMQIAEFTSNGVRANDVNAQRITSSTVAIASIGGDSLVAWDGWGPQQIDREKIRADIFSAASTFKFGGPGLLVSRSGAIRTDPAGIWRGSHYLAAWREQSDTTRIAIARLDATGRSIDGDGVLLGSAGASAPSVATDGHDALVAWAQSDGAYTAHVSANGIVTPRQFSAATFLGNAQVVWNGEEYAACAAKTMVRLRPDGTTKQVATIPNADSYECHLAWSGSQYLVLWRTTEICFPVCIPPTSLWAQAVSADLVPLGGAVRLANPFVAGEPKFANAGDRTLVVWLENDGGARTLQAKRITAPGTVLDAASFEIGETTILGDVFADGENWVVTSGPYAWTVTRSGNVGTRETRYPFIAAGMQSDVIVGGPAPLAIFQSPDASLTPQIYGRFLSSIRQRGVRH
jgi:hypothetical protein